MYKVLSAHGFYEPQFMCNVGRSSEWLVSDQKLGPYPLYSDEALEALMLRSTVRKQFERFLKKKNTTNEPFEVVFSQCSNNYIIWYLSDEALAEFQSYDQLQSELQNVRERIRKAVPAKLLDEEKKLQSKMRKLKKNLEK